MLYITEFGEYPDLFKDFNWKPGIYKAPINYVNKYLIVTKSNGTYGSNSKKEAIEIYNLRKYDNNE